MITHDTKLLIRIFSMSRFSTGCETLAITDKVVSKYYDIPTLCSFYTCFAVVLERFCLQNPKSQKFKLKKNDKSYDGH